MKPASVKTKKIESNLISKSTERTIGGSTERTTERSIEKSAARSTTKSTERTERKTEQINEECKFKEILTFVLNHKKKDESTTAKEFKNKTDYLLGHIKKDRQRCTKCTKESVYLMLGYFYFDSFKRRLGKFKSYVLNKESKSVDENKDKPKDKNWESIKLKNSDTFSDLVNLDSQGKVLEYLMETIDLWKRVLTVKERLKPELIIDLEVFEILKNCYFVFTFYGAVKYIKLTCQIYLELVLLHGQSINNHLLFAYYCQIRFCLDYGLLNKSKNYLRSCNSLINSIPKAKLKRLTIEIHLIKVVECELRLILNEDVEQAADELKELLNDEFFQTVTVLSAYIKCSIYNLASKFSAKLYPAQNLNHFFNECFSFSKSMITKWYPSLNENPALEDQESIRVNSPIWLEFAVCKFTLEFSLTYYFYSVNCSVVDIHFYFNILVTRLARIYCSLLWLSRILILSSYYEKIEVQKVKINQVKNLFKRKKFDPTKINYQQQITNKLNAKKVLTNQTNNIPANQGENELFTIQDDSLDMRTKEYSNCSHHEDTPIYLLKKSMLKNPILNEEAEFISNFNYEKELENLDTYFIPDLIIVKQELLLFLYFINESKESFVNYFQELDLDNVNTAYFESLTNALNVGVDSLNRNHQNLITSSFNMRCLLIYLQQIQLKNSSIIELTRNVLKKANKLGHSYEIHCFITDLILYYVNSLFKEINNGKLNILEYDFIECDKYLLKPLIIDSPVKQRSKLRPRVKPNAPKKVRNYKMDEIKDYIQEMYDVNYQQKNSAKLNFTSSDEEEANEENDKENLKLKISKLKSIREEGLVNDKQNKFEIRSKKAIRNDATYLKEKKMKIVSNALNSLNDRIGNLNLDDDLLDLDKIDFEYLIDESSSDYLFEFRKLLHKALELFGAYPPVKYYNEINTTLFKLSICKESSFDNESAFYFSEACNANALRYKTIDHLQKKQKYVSIKYESKVLEFTNYNAIESKSDELNRMFDILPSKWRVVQIQFIKGSNSQTDLYIARYSRKKNPIILKINVNSEKLCTSFMNEFNEIIKLSNDTVKEEDSSSFWKLRFALDDRLKKLLTDVNSAWISCFIGIFLGECRDPLYRSMFCKIEEKIVEYAKNKSLRCLNEDLLKVICESFIYLKEESFNHSMVTLFEPKNRFDDLYDQCLMIAKRYLKFKTQEELKEKMQKKEIAIEYEPVGLITGNSLENFPFESLFYLKMLNLEIFRIPSIRFLNWMYLNLRRTNESLRNGVSDKDVYYLINPTNNLQFTEEFFKDKFEKLKNKTNWEGLIGKIPSQTELQKALEKKDAYIYFGHNSGVRYIGKMYAFNVNCIAIVMGCSSGALINQDKMVESFGSSYNFLISGCPSYLGCLWNVTDRDIDRFAERFLKRTFKIYGQDEEKDDKDMEKCASIAKALALSRSSCKLKFLNGSAPVLHGLPVSMKCD